MNAPTAARPWGSSPRARGADSHGPEATAPGGVIPAGAGSRPSPPTRSSRTRGHPRGRGEQISTVTGDMNSSGSSPRARGAGRPRGRPGGGGGVIPAGAGSRLLDLGFYAGKALLRSTFSDSDKWYISPIEPWLIEVVPTHGGRRGGRLAVRHEQPCVCSKSSAVEASCARGRGERGRRSGVVVYWRAVELFSPQSVHRRHPPARRSAVGRTGNRT